MTERLLEYLNKYVASIKDEVPGFISISVIDITTGNTLAKCNDTGHKFSIDNILEFNKMQTSTVKYALKGLEYIDELKIKKFEDIIITLEDQTHIIMTSNFQSVMAYIIIDANAGNIALTQTLHKKYYTQLVADAMNDLGEENVRNHSFFQPKDLVTLSTPITEKKEEQKKSSFLHDLFFSN